MTQHPKSRRARIIAAEIVPVRVGKGLVEFKPGWEGPVVPEVADYLAARPHLAEVWRDGEPPAPGQAPGTEEETTVRVVQTDDGPRFSDVAEREPPPFDLDGDGEAAEGEALEGEDDGRGQA